METIVYRKTLDVHKNGIQFTLQGFETADNMARRIEISLMASGDTIDLPLEQMVAMMYVTTPNATEPSINECTIKGNTIIYDVLPIVEPGVTEMQLKLIETRPDGANGVLATPKFGVEVSESNTDDESATQSTTYTALESAIAKANSVYESRLIRIELDSDCMFRAYYADGTMYESDVLKELFLKGDVLLSQSFAKGGTGIRAGEDTDNSMYYSNVSKGASEDTKKINDDSKKILEEVRKHGLYTTFSVDFETGTVEYVSPSYTFKINSNNGQLDAFGEAYTFEKNIEDIVYNWLLNNSVLPTLQENVSLNTNKLNALVDSFDLNVERIVSNWMVDNSGIPEIQENISTNIENINELKNICKNSFTLDNAIAITEGDMNELVETGNYAVATDEIAKKLTNYPCTNAGVVKVINSNGQHSANYKYRVQLVITYQAKIYIRKLWYEKETNSWAPGEWKDITPADYVSKTTTYSRGSESATSTDYQNWSCQLWNNGKIDCILRGAAVFVDFISDSTNGGYVGTYNLYLPEDIISFKHASFNSEIGRISCSINATNDRNGSYITLSLHTKDQYTNQPVPFSAQVIGLWKWEDE
jgi:hypothetical protein